jgi:uncharacterized DUF497 family protein
MYGQNVVAFDWDDANRNHIARHGVLPEDCERAMAEPVVTVPGLETGEPRWKTTGMSKRRPLEVIWTLRGDRYRVVTAYWKTRKQI